MKKLIEGEDFYYNEDGYVVLTETFHLERGHCCGNGCRHCPYDYEGVPEPRREELREKIAKVHFFNLFQSTRYAFVPTINTKRVE